MTKLEEIACEPNVAVVLPIETFVEVEVYRKKVCNESELGRLLINAYDKSIRHLYQMIKRLTALLKEEQAKKARVSEIEGYKEGYITIQIKTADIPNLLMETDDRIALFLKDRIGRKVRELEFLIKEAPNDC
jgi:hypothetical protein